MNLTLKDITVLTATLMLFLLGLSLITINPVLGLVSSLIGYFLIISYSQTIIKNAINDSKR